MKKSLEPQVYECIAVEARSGYAGQEIKHFPGKLTTGPQLGLKVHELDFDAMNKDLIIASRDISNRTQEPGQRQEVERPFLTTNSNFTKTTHKRKLVAEASYDDISNAGRVAIDLLPMQTKEQEINIYIEAAKIFRRESFKSMQNKVRGNQSKTAPSSESSVQSDNNIPRFQIYHRQSLEQFYECSRIIDSSPCEFYCDNCKNCTDDRTVVGEFEVVEELDISEENEDSQVEFGKDYSLPEVRKSSKMVQGGTEVQSSTTPTKNCHQRGQTDKETNLHPSYQMSPQIQIQRRDSSPRDRSKASPNQRALSHSHTDEEISCPAPQELPSATAKHGVLSIDGEEMHTDHPLTVFDSSPTREWSKSDPQSSPFPIPMIKWSEALRQNQDLKLPSHLEGHTVSYKPKNLWAPDILPLQPCKLPSQSSKTPSKLARPFDSVTPSSVDNLTQSSQGKEIPPTKNLSNETIDQQGNQRAWNNKSELRRRGTVRKAMEQETSSFEERSNKGETSKHTSHPHTKRQKVTAEDLCRGTNDFLRAQQQIQQQTSEQVQNAMQETEKLMGSRVWDLDRIRADARVESAKQKSSHRFRSTAAGNGSQGARARDHISDPRTRIKSEPMDYYLSGHGEGQRLNSGYQDLPVSGEPRFKIELGALNTDEIDLSRTRYTSYSSWVPSEPISMSTRERSLTYIGSSPEPQLSSDRDCLRNTEIDGEGEVENEPRRTKSPTGYSSTRSG